MRKKYLIFAGIKSIEMDVKINDSWKEILKHEFSKSYFIELAGYLKLEKANGSLIYPPGGLIFNAFNLTPFDKVKVVILGQDPYHGKGQAHGLSFSVMKGVKPPPSLQNIFKEIESDTGIKCSGISGDLTGWARQGVLLLNASLTVRAAEPMSHAKIGWGNFTDAVIKSISTHRENVVFMLWGRFAQEKQILIDATRHLILKAAHPSPFSAYSGFLGCRHFTRANEYLIKNGKEPIDWKVDD